MEFAELVERDISKPLIELCSMLAEEDEMEAVTFFSGVASLLSDPSDETLVLAAVIELSNCAFIGLTYSEAAKERINDILDKAILLSATMAADNPQ